MSNWAKLQEDTIQLPVFKRAKNGIHFDKGDGEILANFSGKPAHFQDTDGLWKPIDTKLLPLGDGYYGCPHSKVKVHPAGTVKIAGTDYVQYTQLPSGQTGLVDGDKLVRKFSFGEQRMWVTEDGFKSEIQLNRIPTLTEARKLIASESGALSKEYIKGLTTAKDSRPLTDESPQANTHTITTLSAFRTWLTTAVFPVIIDPDFTSATGAGGDDNFNYDNRTYNHGASTVLSNTLGGFLLRFDLSSVPVSTDCTGVNLHFVKTNTAGSDRTRTMHLLTIHDDDGGWVEGTKNGTQAGSGEPCWNAKAADGAGGVTTAWVGGGGYAPVKTLHDVANVPFYRQDAQYTEYDFNFSADGITDVEGWFGDATNNGLYLAPYESPNYGWVDVGSSENATAGYRPVLTVTYTASGIAIPVAQYYNRLRRN